MQNSETFLVFYILTCSTVTEFFVDIIKTALPNTEWKSQAAWRLFVWVLGIPIALVMLATMELYLVFGWKLIPIAMGVSVGGKVWHDIVGKIKK